MIVSSLPVSSVRIIWYSYFLLIWNFQKFSTSIWHLPFTLNVILIFSLLYSAKKDLPKECTLLCGTAVGLLLGIICTELKIFVSTRESIIQLLLVAGKLSIFIFLFPFYYFYLTKLFVSHNYVFILCYSSTP